MKNFLKIFIVISFSFIFSFTFMSPAFSSSEEVKERTLLEENRIKIIHRAKKSYWNKNTPFDEGQMLLFYNNKEKILSSLSYYGYANNEFLHLPRLNLVIYIKSIHEGKQILKFFDYIEEKEYNLDYLSKEFNLRENVDYGFYDLQLSPTGNYFSVQASWFELIGKLFIFNIDKIKAGDLENSYVIPDFDEVHDVNWKKGDIITFQNGLKSINDTEAKIEDIIEGNAKTNQFTKIGIYPPSPFSDLSETDEDYEYVLRAKAEGWLDGYPDGTVKMDQPIKRAEFVKILIRSFKNIEEEVIPEDIKAVCPDVPTDQWYSRAFYTARELGVVQGYPEEGKDKSEWLCKPAQTINRVEALKVVLELAKFNTKNAVLKNQYKDTGIYEWYSPYTAYAKTEDLIKITDSKLHPANPLTRGEMIVLTIKVKDLLGVDDEDWGKW